VAHRLILLGVIGLLWTAAAQDVLPEADRTAAGRLSIAVEKGFFTLKIESCPLRRVLRELGAAAGVSVVTADSVGEDHISTQLTNVSRDEAFRRLLVEYDTFFYYTAEKDAPAALRTIWVYPKRSAVSLRPVPPETWASAKELEASVASQDLAVRERAYEALIVHPDRRSQDLVLQAIRGISERDDGLRQRILSAAVSKGMEMPPHILSELVYAGSSESLRLMALDTLSQHSSVKEVAEYALSDTSEVIRQRAKAILKELDASTRRAEGATRHSEVQP
jgi:type II secretory pathway component GspD/PulD (secretin)